MNLAFAEFLFSLILLVTAYFVTHTINGFVQGYVIDKLGDSTAKDAGYMTLNPLMHVDTFGLIVLIVLGIGWFQTVPIDPYAFTGRLRYVRMFFAFMCEAISSTFLATLSLAICVYHFGYVLTMRLVLKLFSYYSHFLLYVMTSRVSLSLGSLFGEQHSTAAMTGAFLLVSIVYLAILIATISSIFNLFRYLLIVGFERGYAYSDYADYVAILGPLLTVYVLGDHLVGYLLKLTQWGALIIAHLVGV